MLSHFINSLSKLFKLNLIPQFINLNDLITQLITEIKSLFGQPDYRSVNLTWEVDDKYAGNRLNEEKEEETEPKSFFVHYCEIQSWGEYHRCNSKVLVDDDGVDFEK